jgi:hypothetical protein
MAIVLDGTTGITTPDIDSTQSTLGPLTQALNLGSTGQIVFPATQNASANANTLDDYEEGTWTPTVFGATTTGTATVTSEMAKYIKIGNLVQVMAQITWSSYTGTGTLLIGGLPFTVSASGSGATAVPGSVLHNSLVYPTGKQLVLQFSRTNSNCLFRTIEGSAAIGVVTDGSGTVTITINGTYFVD